MDPFGTTRSRTTANHALIAPDSFVASPLPGWDRARGVILIAPPMGARFVQYIALLEPGGRSAPAAPGVERVVYVLEGEVVLEVIDGVEHVLTPGGYLFLPADVDGPIRAVTAARLSVFEKRYAARPGVEPPKPVFGQEQDVAGVPFLGDPDASLKTLLPDVPAFDLAVNLFTFAPGGTLPMVEVHVMEHGLLMIAGQGVYRLGDSWYPVQDGDAIWMAPFCPQWFVAVGKEPARYLYYKDINRDPLEHPG